MPINAERLALAGLAATAVVAAVDGAHKHTPPMDDVAASQPGTPAASSLHRGQLRDTNVMTVPMDVSAD